MRDLSVVLAALYLRGAPRPFDPRPRSWPLVLRALRLHAECMPPSEVLRNAGLWAEAIVLEDPAIVFWARSAVCAGRVLTPACETYPSRLLHTLGEAAPPAFWRCGEVGATPWISLVGSRAPSAAARQFAAEVAREAASLRFGVLSGGAIGIDLSALRSARAMGGPTLEFLPHGVPKRGTHAALSLFPSGEPFSIQAAMERNKLIYAAAECTIVVQSRFKEGGTWHGATEALRQKRCHVLVWRSDDTATRTLIALGAVPISTPQELQDLLPGKPAQQCLFGIG